MSSKHSHPPESRGDCDDRERSETKEDRVEAFLRREASETDGDLYIKSRDVAAATDLSPKQVGPLIARLQRDGGTLSIERWAYSNATTWRVVGP